MRLDWYDYLNNKDKKNLLSSKKIEDNNLIICQQLEYRKFAVLDNYLHFTDLERETEEDKRCFFEVLLSNKRRKPYFDIDIEYDIEYFDECDFLNNIKKIFVSLVPEILTKGAILIFTSHTEKKKSYHVVIAGYYLLNEKESFNFFEKTKNLIDEKYKIFFDASIYKKTQQFRILNSHKYGKNNLKVFREDLSVNFVLPERYTISERAKNNYILSLSLVGHITREIHLDGFEEEQNNFILSQGFASEGDLEDILQIIYQGTEPGLFSFYNMVENNGNILISLRRNRPSYCHLCKRTHENENPFVVVKGIERNVYLYCRRGERSNQLLGSLGQFKIPTDISVDDITDIQKMDEEINYPINLEKIEELSKKNKDRKKSSKYKINLTMLTET